MAWVGKKEEESPKEESKGLTDYKHYFFVYRLQSHHGLTDGLEMAFIENGALF